VPLCIKLEDISLSMYSARISHNGKAALYDALRAPRFTLEEKSMVELLISALLSAGFDSSASHNLAGGLLRSGITTMKALLHSNDALLQTAGFAADQVVQFKIGLRDKVSFNQLTAALATAGFDETAAHKLAAGLISMDIKTVEALKACDDSLLQKAGFSAGHLVQLKAGKCRLIGEPTSFEATRDVVAEGKPSCWAHGDA